MAGVAKAFGARDNSRATSTAITAQGRYYLGQYEQPTQTRAFVGLGAGLYYPGAVVVDVTADGAITYAPKAVPSLSPRVGITMGRFTGLLEANIAGRSEVTYTTGGGTDNARLNNSYFSVKAGVVIGGGQL